MTKLPRYWRTGIPELDELLFDGRGFRDGRGYILSGPHQAGKTILAMCFVKSMIAQGGAITYMTIGRPAKDLVELYQEFNIDVNNYLEKMDLVILDWATIRSGGEINRVKRQLGQYLSEKAIANIRFGVDPCNKEEFLNSITEIHEEKAKFHGKPGIGVVDAISDQVVLVSRKGLPGSIVSDIYFTARQRFSMEEPGIAFHLFAPLEERVSREYSVLLEDLHLNEDGTINLEFELSEGEIKNRSMGVRSLLAGKAPTRRLRFDINVEDLIRITDYDENASAMINPAPGVVPKQQGCTRTRDDLNPLRSYKIFFVYSHADEHLKDELEKHLSLLKRTGDIFAWHDRRITPGSEWKNKIDDQLNTAQIILLLVSADFLASDYCYDVEMKHALKLHDAKTSCVIPVILRACDWKNAPFGKLQAVPKDGRPITSWTNRDEAFADLVMQIRKCII